MTIARKALKNPIGKEAVGPETRTLSLLKGRYCFENFMQEPECHVKGSLTEPNGSATQEAVVFTGLNKFEYTFVGGDLSDAFMPVLASEGGYNWAGMSADALTRGVEINFGGLKAGHPRNFVPDEEDWFARVLIIVDDVSGADILFGFHKNATATPSLTEIVDLVGIRILGDDSSALAAITAVTNQNNDGTTDATSTAHSASLTDATVMELELRSVGGVSQMLINGVPFLPNAQFTFDASDVFYPFLRILQVTDLVGQAKTLCYEAGPLADRRPETLLVLAGATT